LASGINNKDEKTPTGTEAGELVSHALSALAHELGGITGALDLRTSVLSGTISAQDLAALRSLVDELRQATRAVRLVRGPDGSGKLDPSRTQSLADWWKMSERFVTNVLPRGLAVDARMDDGQLDAEQASTLTWILLAGCKILAERGIKTPGSIAVHGGPAATGTAGLTIVVEVAADQVTAQVADSSRWLHYATRLAEVRGMSPPRWEEDGARLRWTCTVKPRS
jgi:hypothetical protein